MVCRMDEAAVQVTGLYYNALRGQRDEIASTSLTLYTETSVRPHIAIMLLTLFISPCCIPALWNGCPSA